MKALLMLSCLAGACADSTIQLSSALPPTGYDFVFVPFTVPPGTAEIEISHAQTGDPTNIIDWGLLDPRGNPAGYVGWGGGNHEPLIVGPNATSRSYLLNELVPGAGWQVVLGKAKISVPPGAYSINITFRDAATLPPQVQRRPYVPAAPLDVPPTLTWYAGDFHVHSCESGDAFVSATLDEIATYAESQGLDFVHISDHNTVSASTFMVDAQSRHPKLLLLPGVEWTTYYGHGGAILTTGFVDHKVGLPNVTVVAAAAAIHAQGGLFSMNHEDMYEQGPDLRNRCIGCAWDYGGSVPMTSIDAMEVAIQAWDGLGWVFSPRALEWWDHLHFLGFTHVAPIGGSDDHHGGANETKVGPWEAGSSIGHPATMVLAANLSHAAVREALALGRTALKMSSALDPLADLAAAETGGGADAVRVGGSLRVSAPSANVTLTATVTMPQNASAAGLAAAVARAGRPRAAPGAVLELQFVRNNAVWHSELVTLSPGGGAVTVRVTAPSPLGGTDRWRAELHDVGAQGVLRSMTNHIFVVAASDV